tara:strand:- start:1377 stop:1646 length:270 start_codon:yes stop_codon:yes gene_type:complete
VITGVLVVNLIGTIMIKKNKLYYCELYCDDTDLYYVYIALSLHDEEEIDYNNFSDYTFDGSLYDVVDVLVNNEIKTVLTTELVEIEKKK